MIRSYIEQFYIGNDKELEGDWLVNETVTTSFKISNDRLSATWQESAGFRNEYSYTVEINGKVSGSTFAGSYTRKNDSGRQPVTLLSVSSNKNVSCIGYATDGGNKVNIISSKLKDDFSLSLSKVEV